MFKEYIGVLKMGYGYDFGLAMVQIGYWKKILKRTGVAGSI
jgi:hypothetical protein